MVDKVLVLVNTPGDCRVDVERGSDGIAKFKDRPVGLPRGSSTVVASAAKWRFSKAQSCGP